MKNRVYYATDEVSQATYISLLKNQSLEVLFMDSFIDTHFVSFLEQEYSDVKFARVDADLDDILLDEDQSNEIIDPETKKTRSEQVKEAFEQALNRPQVTIRTEALKSADNSAPPAVVLVPEELRRMQEMSAFLQQQSAQFPDSHTLLVNTAHPIDPKPHKPTTGQHYPVRWRSVSFCAASLAHLRAGVRLSTNGSKGL